MASKSEQIAAMKTELEELKIRQRELKNKIEMLEEIPVYINEVIEVLKKRLGSNIEYETKIRKDLEEGLSSLPKYSHETDNVKHDIYNEIDIVSYLWKGKRIRYEVIEENHYHGCEAEALFTIYNCKDKECMEPYSLRTLCARIYATKDWTLLDTFDSRYMPILIGYLEYQIEHVGYIKY